MKFSAADFITFLLSISIMLFFAKLLGELFNKFKQPAIIGEILAGIILGPTILGMFAPGIFNWLFPENNSVKIALDGITNVAVVLLLLVSGLEIDLSIVLKHRKTAVSTSIIGIIIPFILGFCIAYFFPFLMGIKDTEMRFVFALFIGTAIAISSLPVIAKILMDLNIFKTQIGFIIMAAAMLNDLIGWLIFSIILGLIGATGHQFSFAETLFLTLAFVTFVLLIGREITGRLVPIIQDKLSYPGGILNFILILGFLCAAFTEYIGVHAIFGAFIIGIAIGDSVHLKEQTREIIHQFVTNIFAPLFFVSIGLRVNFIANFDFVIVTTLLIIATTGKVIGCALGARIGGLNKNESLAVGFGMSSSGAMGIIIGLLALQFGLIQEEVFVGLVIMALFTSIASAPLMNYFLKKRKEISFNGLLKAELLIFSKESEKENIISELAEVISANSKINKSEIVEKVLEREKTGSSGIANHLAIPHAKLKISKPIAAIAFNDKGIDFQAVDDLPARVIILLLTPQNDNRIQLNLLSEIAHKFKDKEKIEKLFSLKEKDDIIKAIKEI